MEILLGMIIGWFIFGFILIVCDFFEREDISWTIIGFPFLSIKFIIEKIIEGLLILKVIDLCIKYHIPLYTNVNGVKEKLDEEGKDKWIKRMPKKNRKDWENFLKR